MPLDPNDPFLEGTIRNMISEEIGRVTPLIRQLQNGLVPTFTTSSLPAASGMAGHVVFVSNAAAGSKFQGSDGSSWLSLG